MIAAFDKALPIDDKDEFQMSYVGKTIKSILDQMVEEGENPSNFKYYTLESEFELALVKIEEDK